MAAATALAARGADVIVTSRRQEAADSAASHIASTGVAGRVVGHAAHAASEEAAQACVARALEKFGRLDILINNAGTNASYGPLIDQERKRFEKTFEVNLWAPLRWTAIACKAWMLEHGGAVVNTASKGSFVTEPNLGVYNATKAALVHLTRQMAYELGPHVRVNAVAPGVVRTRLSEALWTEQEESLGRTLPLRRIGEPVDIGGAVAFLASDAASWITGTTLLIDGGDLLGDASRLPASDAESAG
jgi:NAD(P)-dependent dehydrogenase (short-subunit alcohol dehydrogenase family)